METKPKLRLSASAINDFTRCPYSFKLGYIDKVRPIFTDNVYTAFGKAIHSSIQEFVDCADKNIEVLESIYKKNYETNKKVLKRDTDINKYNEFFEKGLKHLKIYYEYEISSNRYKYLSLNETKLTVDFQDFIVVGVIDRLYKKNSQIVLLDFKTGSKFPTQAEMDSNIQLTMYSFLLYKNYDYIPTDLRLFFLESNLVMKTTRTLEDLLKFEKYLIDFYNTVINIKEWSFDSTKCFWCPFSKQCDKAVKKVKIL